MNISCTKSSESLLKKFFLAGIGHTIRLVQGQVLAISKWSQINTFSISHFRINQLTNTILNIRSQLSYRKLGALLSLPQMRGLWLRTWTMHALRLTAVCCKRANRASTLITWFLMPQWPWTSTINPEGEMLGIAISRMPQLLSWQTLVRPHFQLSCSFWLLSGLIGVIFSIFILYQMQVMVVACLHKLRKVYFKFPWRKKWVERLV